MQKNKYITVDEQDEHLLYDNSLSPYSREEDIEPEEYSFELIVDSSLVGDDIDYDDNDII